MRKFVYTFLLFTLTCSSVTLAQSVRTEAETRDEQAMGKTNTVNISVSENYMYLSGVKEGTKVEVMNMLGVPVLSFLTSNETEKIALDLKKGFYVVRVENIIQRIVIK